MKRLFALPAALPAALAGFLIASAAAPSIAAAADNTITVKWTNNTGKSISAAYTYCAPSGTCTYPSSISNGSTGTIKQTASSTAYMRSMTFRYRYYDFNDYVYKSCQLQGWVMKESTGCTDLADTISFQRTDGTGSSPTCNNLHPQVTRGPGNCEFNVSVSMSN